MNTLSRIMFGACLSIAGVAPSMAFAAPTNESCDKACRNAAAVFASPHTNFVMIVRNEGEISTLYVTWESKDNLELAPAKYKGVVRAKLHSTQLREVKQSTSGDSCSVVIQVVDVKKKGAELYSVPMRNVACGSEA